MDLSPRSTITMPLSLGDATLGDVEVPVTIDASNLANIKIDVGESFVRDVATALVAAAVRLAPDVLGPQKWITGMGQTSVDQHDEDAPLVWPTTPGSAVLADRHSGAGPQVLVLCAWADGDRSRPAWWGGHGRGGAHPGSGWSWSGDLDRIDLLQVLYVAP